MLGRVARLVRVPSRGIHMQYVPNERVADRIIKQKDASVALLPSYTFPDGSVLVLHKAKVPATKALEDGAGRDKIVALTDEQAAEAQQLRLEDPFRWTTAKLAAKYNTSVIAVSRATKVHPALKKVHAHRAQERQAVRERFIKKSKDGTPRGSLARFRAALNAPPTFMPLRPKDVPTSKSN